MTNESTLAVPTLSIKPCNVDDLSPKPEDKAKEHLKSKKQIAMEWGRPGHLTQTEVEVFCKFRDEANKRGGEYLKTIYSFSFIEEEAYALTRWLRARKYNLQDTITMVEEATECRSSPREFDYYPDAEKALGNKPELFIAMYPQLYSGFSKVGCPVFYSKPGQLNIDGLECITTLGGILKYHWHAMQHDYRNRLLEFKKSNPSFQRFECVSILDLQHLTLSKISSRVMDITKEQASIDSLCFPETMNKMIILNAPIFFNATWKIVKGFVDVRTSAKIELFSSTTAAKKCLKELIDDDQLPSDYGGKAESTVVTMDKMSEGNKLITQVLAIKSSDSKKITIGGDEEVDIWIYTRSTQGAKFQILNEQKKDLIPIINVKNSAGTGGGGGEVETVPSKTLLTVGGKIKGPLTVKVKGTIDSGGYFTSVHNFLVVCNISKKV